MNEIWEIENSSQLKRIEYDEFAQILIVTFVKGSIYEYYDVPAYINYGLVIADSAGSYFNKNIARKFKFEKVG